MGALKVRDYTVKDLANIVVRNRKSAKRKSVLDTGLKKATTSKSSSSATTNSSNKNSATRNITSTKFSRKAQSPKYPNGETAKKLKSETNEIHRKNVDLNIAVDLLHAKNLQLEQRT